MSSRRSFRGSHSVLCSLRLFVPETVHAVRVRVENRTMPFRGNDEKIEVEPSYDYDSIDSGSKVADGSLKHRRRPPPRTEVRRSQPQERVQEDILTRVCVCGLAARSFLPQSAAPWQSWEECFRNLPRCRWAAPIRLFQSNPSSPFQESFPLL